MTVERLVAVAASAIAIASGFAAYHATFAGKEEITAALSVMLGEVEDDRAGDLYWLKQKEASEGLTPYEQGRKGTIETALQRVERQQEALD